MLTEREAVTCTCGTRHLEFSIPRNADSQAKRMDSFMQSCSHARRASMQGGLPMLPVTGCECYVQLLSFAQVSECFMHLAIAWVVENYEDEDDDDDD